MPDRQILHVSRQDPGDLFAFPTFAVSCDHGYDLVDPGVSPRFGRVSDADPERLGLEAVEDELHCSADHTLVALSPAYSTLAKTLLGASFEERVAASTSVYQNTKVLVTGEFTQLLAVRRKVSNLALARLGASLRDCDFEWKFEMDQLLEIYLEDISRRPEIRYRVILASKLIQHDAEYPEQLRRLAEQIPIEEIALDRAVRRFLERIKTSVTRVEGGFETDQAGTDAADMPGEQAAGEIAVFESELQESEDSYSLASVTILADERKRRMS